MNEHLNLDRAELDYLIELLKPHSSNYLGSIILFKMDARRANLDAGATISNCPTCGNDIWHDGKGQVRKYCCDPCKMKAYRERIKSR